MSTPTPPTPEQKVVADVAAAQAKATSLAGRVVYAAKNHPVLTVVVLAVLVVLAAKALL